MTDEHTNETPLRAMRRDFIAFQKEMPRAIANNKAGHNYKYADLAELHRQLGPLLSKHNFAYIDNTDMEVIEGKMIVSVTSSLLHLEGESIWNTMKLWLPQNGRNQAHDLGSLFTYLRRYNFKAITGVSGAEDDDDAASLKTEIKKIGFQEKKIEIQKKLAIPGDQSNQDLNAMRSRFLDFVRKLRPELQKKIAEEFGDLKALDRKQMVDAHNQIQIAMKDI